MVIVVGTFHTKVPEFGAEDVIVATVTKAAELP